MKDLLISSKAWRKDPGDRDDGATSRRRLHINRSLRIGRVVEESGQLDAPVRVLRIPGGVARGPHLEALRRDGLTIVSPKGNLRLSGIKATDRPEEIGPADIVLFSVKLYDAEAATNASSILG